MESSGQVRRFRCRLFVSRNKKPPHVSICLQKQPFSAYVCVSSTCAPVATTPLRGAGVFTPSCSGSSSSAESASSVSSLFAELSFFIYSERRRSWRSAQLLRCGERGRCCSALSRGPRRGCSRDGRLAAAPLSAGAARTNSGFHYVPPCEEAIQLRTGELL